MQGDSIKINSSTFCRPTYRETVRNVSDGRLANKTAGLLNEEGGREVKQHEIAPSLIRYSRLPSLRLR